MYLPGSDEFSFVLTIQNNSPDTIKIIKPHPHLFKSHFQLNTIQYMGFKEYPYSFTLDLKESCTTTVELIREVADFEEYSLLEPTDLVTFPPASIVVMGTITLHNQDEIFCKEPGALYSLQIFYKPVIDEDFVMASVSDKPNNQKLLTKESVMRFLNTIPKISIESDKIIMESWK